MSLAVTHTIQFEGPERRLPLLDVGRLEAVAGTGFRELDVVDQAVVEFGKAPFELGGDAFGGGTSRENPAQQEERAAESPRSLHIRSYSQVIVFTSAGVVKRIGPTISPPPVRAVGGQWRGEVPDSKY